MSGLMTSPGGDELEKLKIARRAFWALCRIARIFAGAHRIFRPTHASCRARERGARAHPPARFEARAMSYVTSATTLHATAPRAVARRGAGAGRAWRAVDARWRSISPPVSQQRDAQPRRVRPAARLRRPRLPATRRPPPPHPTSTASSRRSARGVPRGPRSTPTCARGSSGRCAR